MDAEGKTVQGQQKIAAMLRRIYDGVVQKGASKGKLASLESLADRACSELGLPYGWLTRMDGKGHGDIPILARPPALPHKSDGVKRRVSFSESVVAIDTPSKRSAAEDSATEIEASPLLATQRSARGGA